MEYQEEFEQLDDTLIDILKDVMPQGVVVERLTTIDVGQDGVFTGLLIGTDGLGYAFEVGEESARVGVVETSDSR